MVTATLFATLGSSGHGRRSMKTTLLQIFDHVIGLIETPDAKPHSSSSSSSRTLQATCCRYELHFLMLDDLSLHSFAQSSQVQRWLLRKIKCTLHTEYIGNKNLLSACARQSNVFFCSGKVNEVKELSSNLTKNGPDG